MWSLRALAMVAAVFVPVLATAGPIAPREGWAVIATPHAYAALNARVDAAISRAGMGLVNAASASQGAAAQGITIPGNRVVGVFRNDFARRMLAASLAAGIEAPIRLYVTENADGTATLSYRLPSAVFAPYASEGGTALATLAAELDGIMRAIAADAAGR
jgi:uncharacterized protein (DUF302 family)